MKYALSIILLIGYSLTTFAQDKATTTTTANLDTISVSRDISVEKNYIPEIKDMHRPQIELRANEPKVSKNDVEYSEYSTFLNPKSVFNPLPQTDLRILRRKKSDNGFAQAAFGFPLLWNAEVFYPLLNSRQTSLSVHANHDGYFSTKQLLDTDVAIDLSHKISRKMGLIAAVDYSNQYFNYYGNDDINRDSTALYFLNDKTFRGDSLFANTQTIHSVNATFGIMNIKDDAELDYEAIVNYKFSYFNSNALNEHIIDARVGVSKQLQEMHRLGIYADINSSIYNNPTNTLPTHSETNTVIGIYPSYRLEWNNLKVKAGAKIFISTPNGATVSGSPDVHASYVYKDLFEANVGFDGEYKINTMSSILEENRYFNANNSIGENTYTPLKAYASFNIRPITGLLINAHVNYSIIKNQYFFTNEYYNLATLSSTESPYLQSNLFTSELSDANLFNIGFTANYNHKEKYVAYCSFDYNYWDVDAEYSEAWFKPAFQISAGTRIEVIQNLYVNLDFNFESGRKYKLTNTDGSTQINKMNNIYDLNVGAYYSIMNNWTVFAKVNNILGNIPSVRYQQWYGYDNIGCNVLFGLNLSF